MRIIKINNQMGNDFWADMECESCGHIEKNVTCYNDSNFHMRVIPRMICKECGKSSWDYKGEE